MDGHNETASVINRIVQVDTRLDPEVTVADH